MAGPLTFVVFAVGIIICTGMLAGSAAYALGEALAWPVGLAVCRRVPRRSTRRRGLNFSSVDPIRALCGSTVMVRDLFSAVEVLRRAFRMPFRHPDHRKILCGRGTIRPPWGAS